jgi:hypothetical protein
MRLKLVAHRQLTAIKVGLAHLVQTLPPSKCMVRYRQDRAFLRFVINMQKYLAECISS